MKLKPVTLIILDGYGYNPNEYGNAVLAAKKPFIDKLFKEYPNTLIGASGLDVGLPDGQMGNSEVGHTNIGAGRIVYQDLTRISKAIKDGDFFNNEELLSAMDNCKLNGSTLHLFGLCSDGGVHSHISHLYALLEMAKKNGVENVLVHCFMDGRDVPPESGAGYVEELMKKIDEIGVGKVASVIGRYYAMDRDKRWERVKLAYDAVVNNVGAKYENPAAGIKASYKEGITDEFIKPIVCLDDAGISDGDSIIFYNFRPDRARELTRAIVDDEFNSFDSPVSRLKVKYVCMTQYDVTIPNVQIAYKPQSLTNTFGSYIADKGLKQLRIAETEKYAHVTFFFNGGKEEPFEGEDRALVNSPKVATYDLQPEMSAYEVTDEMVKRVGSGKYDAIILNYANPDMVGHTGVLSAAIEAVQHIDKCLEKTVTAILNQGGAAIITADHGNCDKMYEADGSPFTAHTTNPVPLLVVGAGDVKLREGGVLADLAPTMLKLMGLEVPAEMEGTSIIL